MRRALHAGIPELRAAESGGRCGLVLSGSRPAEAERVRPLLHREAVASRCHWSRDWTLGQINVAA